MTTAIYPGSFNPWHEGHDDVVFKAACIFDTIIVAQGPNPDKSRPKKLNKGEIGPIAPDWILNKIIVEPFNGFLHKFVERVGNVDAIIRGLRNTGDFQKELTQQYYYEDLGLKIPIIYFGSDRQLAHLSSSAIRAIQKFDKHYDGTVSKGLYSPRGLPHRQKGQ